MKIRVTIVYDCDEDSFGQLAKERQDWLDGNVTVYNILAAEAGTVTFEQVED